MIVISIFQVSKAGKAVKIITKASLKPKKDTKKSDSVSMSSDSFSEIIVKHTCQNWAPAKGDFVGWLRVPNHKLHRLMLWDSEENAKRQGLQRRLFERNIFFIIEILRGNVESKVELLIGLTKIEKHYFSVYMMCQILMSAINVEIPFINWDILFKFTINKHENGILYGL